MFVVVFGVVFFEQKTAYEMRISDWSSDVCSSDLERGDELAHRGFRDALAAGERLELLVGIGQAVAAHDGLHGFGEDFLGCVEVGGQAFGIDRKLDRKSVVEGKGGSVRVDLGGRRIIKKKKHQKVEMRDGKT